MVYSKNITNGSICKVLNRYDLILNTVASLTDIPYGFWGAPEAGRKIYQLFVQFDTPLNSILHEVSHYCLHVTESALSRQLRCR